MYKTPPNQRDKIERQVLDFVRYNRMLRESTIAAEQQFLKLANDITTTQLRLLLAVSMHTPCTMSKLADVTYLTYGNITQAIDKLEEKLFVKRIRSESDRRVIFLELTEKGSDICKAYDANFKEVCKDWFDKITEPEREQFMKIMGKLVN